jgi:serine/threonine-protein kinase
LDQIVLKALQPEPQLRYADAAELARDLDYYLAKMPVSARPNTWSYRAMKLIQRHPIRVSVAGIFLVLLGVPMLWQRAMRAETEATLTRARECCQVMRQFEDEIQKEIMKEVAARPGGETVSRTLLKKMSQFKCDDPGTR